MNSNDITIIFSADGHYYAIPSVRECGLWLSMAKHPLPVPPEWHYPASLCACVMRGRDYYRIGVYGPQRDGGSKPIRAEHELVKDYRDAAWWTPGLEEAWVEAQGLGEALAQATKLHVCEAPAKAQDLSRLRKSGGEKIG
jgi:hypothetical protein